jgi:hypothetical protein
MIPDAETCRNYIPPKPGEAGWTTTQISEQKLVPDGRILVSAPSTRRPAGPDSEFQARQFPLVHGGWTLV